MIRITKRTRRRQQTFQTVIYLNRALRTQLSTISLDLYSPGECRAESTHFKGAALKTVGIKVGAWIAVSVRGEEVILV